MKQDRNSGKMIIHKRKIIHQMIVIVMTVGASLIRFSLLFLSVAAAFSVFGLFLGFFFG